MGSRWRKRQAAALQAAPRARSGFTIIELLVVIGIIAFLAALTLTIVGEILTTAKRRRTQTTIAKIDSLMLKRMNAFERAIEQQNEAATVPQYAAAVVGPLGLSSVSVVDGTELAKVLGRKHLFRSVFPQRFVEANLTYPSPADVRESSEMMYFFLTQMESYGIAAVGEGDFDSQELADADNDGRIEFVDGWGKPLRFYRWPTLLQGTIEGATLLGPTNASSTGDPDDPLGLVESWTAAVFAGSETGATPTDFEDPASTDPDPAMADDDVYDFHTVATYHTPLIVSVGPDSLLGLFEPHGLDAADTLHTGRLAGPNGSPDDVLDNLSNRNIRAGGN